MGPQALLRRAHYVPLALMVGWAVILGLLLFPAVQTELVFMHRANVPFFARFDHPERYGLAPFKTRNLRLRTADGAELGAWHVLPRSVYTKLEPFPPRAPLGDAAFDSALAERPTVIYFHGNAGNRATAYRVRTCSALSTQLDCNVLAIDYRGYGDSTGLPSEPGLLADARAAWDYVAARLGADGRPEESVVLAGHSLGTGVASGLAGALAREGKAPRAIVLLAPFTSISDILSTYRIFLVVPILGPLRFVPNVQDYLRSFLRHPFDSATALSNTTSPTLIVHAADDLDIPHAHGAALFARAHAALDPDADVAIDKVAYDGWGTVRSFVRPSDGHGGAGEVVFWEGRQGGHNAIGWTEGTLDLIARVARL
ncbi:hypothetical protein Q5752_004836 [Cryptotrichosporon argae]